MYVEVGAREWFVQRPLTARAISRLHELGFARNAVNGDFFRDGVALNSVELGWLVEQLFLNAYEVPLDFAVSASFKNERAAKKLRSMIRIATSGC